MGRNHGSGAVGSAWIRLAIAQNIAEEQRRTTLRADREPQLRKLCVADSLWQCVQVDKYGD
eukprot:scaffold92929_cov36-Tisochrysis_lutea.AAC.5